jgi:histidinol-phosphate aminotransferase
MTNPPSIPLQTKREAPAKYIRDAVLALPLVGREMADPRFHRLHWNENPYDFPEDLKEEVLQRLSKMRWANYPDGLRPFALIDRFAQHAQVDPSMVIVTPGSSELIRVALSAVLDPGDGLVMPSPTFILYSRNARALNAVVYEVACQAEDDFALPVAQIIATARQQKAKLVVLCAPNNPTGTVYAYDDLRRVAAQCGALLVIDEAYREFCDQDLRPLLDEFDNVVLLRTLSKAYALAGMRIGYALAAPSVAGELQKVVLSFPLGVMAEVMATVVLDHWERFRSSTAQIVAERRRMEQALRVLPGLQVFSSGANFLLVRPKAAAHEIAQHLREQEQILISETNGYPTLPNYLRISIGLPAENDAVIRALSRY